MGWIKNWWQFMTNTTFGGAAFSYGKMISRSRHPAHTDFSFRRTLCFNDASRLIPETQFCLRAADRGPRHQHKGWGAGTPAAALPV